MGIEATLSGLSKYEVFDIIDGFLERFKNLNGCNMPVKYVVDYINDSLKHSDSTVCPCCNESVGKPVQRRLSKSLLCFLYVLYLKGKATHYEDIKQEVLATYSHNTTDYTVLSKYNFIEGDNGKYTVTEKGKSFLHGKLSVPSWLKIKRDSIIATSTKQVHISQFDMISDLSYEKEPQPGNATIDEVKYDKHPQALDKDDFNNYLENY